MPEYIEREALIEFVKQNIPNINGETSIECVERAIRAMPSADVVEVVRCKDCKHLMFSDCYGECRRNHLGIVRPDDYCSYGKRKEGENNA